MLDIIAIARCHRCNVISLPIYPTRSDPTYASITLPFDWQAVRWYSDGEDIDIVLCPECKDEAWEWASTKVERKSSSEGMCLAIHYDFRGSRDREFCDLPKGHTGEHSHRCNARSWDGTGIGGAFCTLPSGHDGAHGSDL